MAGEGQAKAKKSPATNSGVLFWYLCGGLHHIYLGNVVKGVLFATFLDPYYPSTMWFCGLFCFGWFGNLVREANDDPKYDDEIKEKIKAGKKPSFELIDHFYASYMIEGLSRFIIFNFKYNFFPEWPDMIATLVYLFTGLLCSYCVYASTASKWAHGSLPLVMVSGLLSTVAMVFLDKGAPPRYIPYLISFKEYLPPIVCLLTRRYKKTPSKYTTREHTKLGFIVFLLLWPSYHISTNNWIRNGTVQLLTGKALNHGLPLAEVSHVVGKHAKGSYITAGRMLMWDMYSDKKWTRKPGEKLFAALYAEAYMPWDSEEMTPLEARELLKVDIGADKKKLHKAYRDASRTWHPDKHPDNVKHAEMMQGKISEAKTVLGYYDERVEDGFVHCDEWRRGWGEDFKYKASTRVTQEDNVVHLTKEEMIPFLAENYCAQMKEMYAAIYLQDLLDLGEEPECLQLAEHISEIQGLYDGTPPPLTNPGETTEEGAAEHDDGSAE
ncbi:J domain-containing protein [Chloropicon primus]|uniref:J domain-containing protein n=1 Tax=Chloropicon primus TaxID=1764295 RepID=A0A5B8MH71_9CHLO|nr:hypothetical protein A3770_02p15730 [Chloropicon primus]UPQ98264.1 J domain-containing protein [Chloropicon primus]|eukprot:QDZ19055.1 hypothetical protein A3770_02p15730 [Chloropicon primus]